MENEMSAPQTNYATATNAEKIAIHEEVITNLRQSILSKQEQIRKIMDDITRDQDSIAFQEKRIKELKPKIAVGQFVNIATNEIIPNEQITPSSYNSAWYYNNRITATNLSINPIFTFPDNKGGCKFYVETPCVNVKLSELQVGDIIKHNFSDYWREVPNYCVVVKITDKQVQFQPYRKEKVGYEGDQHSFNSDWYKFIPTLDSEKKPYKMNKSSSWRKVISENKIDKYIGEPNNMYADRKYDGGA